MNDTINYAPKVHPVDGIRVHTARTTLCISRALKIGFMFRLLLLLSLVLHAQNERSNAFASGVGFDEDADEWGEHLAVLAREVARMDLKKDAWEDRAHDADQRGDLRTATGYFWKLAETDELASSAWNNLGASFNPTVDCLFLLSRETP